MQRNTLPALGAVLLTALGACDQRSQTLPFDPDPRAVTQRSIGPAGGLVSHPAGISIEFPPGALTRATKITIAPGLRLSDFPGSPEGKIVRGTYFNVYPAELELLKPINVDLAVSAATLDESDRTRLGFATRLAEAGIRTEGVSFDLTSGILRGEVGTLGAIAAVISDNAIVVTPETPRVLFGGTFADATASGVSGATGVGAPADSLSRSYSANGPFQVRCSHTGFVRRCFGSGTMELWASSEIQDRLSGDMVILNTEVTGDLEFTDFANGVPTKAYGRLTVTGTLRVQLGQAITSFTVEDTFVTTGTAGGTSVTVEGSSITLHSTSTGERRVGFQVRPAGTGEELIVRGEKTVEFDNTDGSKTSAALFIDLRLRR